MLYSGSRTDWWRKRDPARADANQREQAVEAVQAARTTEKSYSWRSQAIIRANAMYGLSAGLGTSMRIGARPLTENVFAQMTDTFTSFIGAAQPRAMWVPIDGDSFASDRADLLANWLDDIVRRTHLRATRYSGIRDRAICGSDCLRPVRMRPGQPLRIKRDHPINVVMDDALSNEMPGDLWIRSLYSRSTLRTLFGDDPIKLRAIDSAAAADKTTWFMARTNLDVIEVWDCWHLDPRGQPGKGDEFDSEGRHIQAIHGCTLYDEPWHFDRPGAAIGRCLPPPYGYWGCSYWDRLANIQEEYNRQMRMEQEILHTYSVPLFFLAGGSRIGMTKFLDDKIARVVTCSGSTPVPFSPQVSPDIWQRSDRRRAAMAEGYGVSQMASQQIKPAGIDTAPAFRAYRDNQNARHAISFEEDGQAMLDLARCCMDLEVIAALNDPSHRVPCARMDGRVSTYAWSDVYLDETNGMLAVMPAGLLTGTITEQLERLGELRALGLIDDQMAQRLIEAPDFKRARNLATAPEDLINKNLDAICRGENVQDHLPEPWYDFALAKRQWALKMNRAVCDERGPEAEEAMRVWRENLFALKDRMMKLPPQQAELMGFDTEAAAAEQQSMPQTTPTSGAVPLPMQDPAALGIQSTTPLPAMPGAAQAA